MKLARDAASTALRDPEDAHVRAQLTAAFHEHADFVWRALRRLGASEADAEDGLQEVFLVVGRRVSEYTERGAVRAWLFVIARQVVFHQRRGASRRERKHTEKAREPADNTSDPARAFEQKEAAALVRACLDQLDEGQALVFYLADIEGMTAPEIATALDLKLNTVYGRLRLGRARFEQLAKQHALRMDGL